MFLQNGTGGPRWRYELCFANANGARSTQAAGVIQAAMGVTGNEPVPRTSSGGRESASLRGVAWWTLLAVLAAGACGRTALEVEGEQPRRDAGLDVTRDCGQVGAACGSDHTADVGYDGPPIADGTCPEGLFTLVIDAGASGVALDETTVYWTTYEVGDDAATGAILSVPKCGGVPRTLAEHQSVPLLLTLDSTHVYWPNSGDGTVARVAKSGGTPETLATNQLEPLYVATDGVDVYWTTFGQNPELEPSASLARVSVSGGEPQTLSSKQLALGAIALDGHDVFFGAFTSLDVVSRNGGAIRPLAAVGLPIAIVIADESIYCLGTYSPDLLRVPRDGGVVTTLASIPFGDGPASGLLVDETSVYWCESVSGQVLRVPKDGGVVTTLASGQKEYTGALVGDGRHLYWAAGNSIIGLTLE
jgi:hypothetical protein